MALLSESWIGLLFHVQRLLAHKLIKHVSHRLCMSVQNDFLSLLSARAESLAHLASSHNSFTDHDALARVNGRARDAQMRMAFKGDRLVDVILAEIALPL